MREENDKSRWIDKGIELNEEVGTEKNVMGSGKRHRPLQ